MDAGEASSGCPVSSETVSRENSSLIEPTGSSFTMDLQTEDGGVT